MIKINDIIIIHNLIYIYIWYHDISWHHIAKLKMPCLRHHHHLFPQNATGHELFQAEVGWNPHLLRASKWRVSTVTTWWHHRDLMGKKQRRPPWNSSIFVNPKKCPKWFFHGEDFDIFIEIIKFSKIDPHDPGVSQLWINWGIIAMSTCGTSSHCKTLHQANAAPKHPEGALQDSIFIGEKGNLFWSLESSTSVNLHFPISNKFSNFLIKISLISKSQTSNDHLNLWLTYCYFGDISFLSYLHVTYLLSSQLMGPNLQPGPSDSNALPRSLELGQSHTCYGQCLKLASDKF